MVEPDRRSRKTRTRGEKTNPPGFPEGFDGGAEGNRTPDLYNAIVALSQLSYGPIVLGDVSASDGYIRAAAFQGKGKMTEALEPITLKRNHYLIQFKCVNRLAV